MEEIIDKEGLTAALDASREQPVFLFKHSTACPISSAAYREVDRYVRSNGDGKRPVYLVKVIESRPVSNAIADATGVEHKSPQMILMAEGKAVWSASHYGISEPEIVKAAAGC